MKQRKSAQSYIFQQQKTVTDRWLLRRGGMTKRLDKHPLFLRIKGLSAKYIYTEYKGVLYKSMEYGGKMTPNTGGQV